MKNLNYRIFALIIFTGVMLTGCSKKDSDPPLPGDDGNGLFTATISGNNFTSDQNRARAVHTYGSGGGQQYTLFVGGIDETNETSIGLWINHPTEIQPGTYQLKFITNCYSYYYEHFETPSVVAWVAPDYTNSDVNVSHGMVTITEISATNAKGTFNFIARESPGTSMREITNGSFDVPLTKQGF